LRRLRDVEFSTIADGHFGTARDARRSVRRVRGRDDELVFDYPVVRPLACSRDASTTH